ncbi:MAG: hypothetical protein NT129_05480 [Candidatus Aenigmarchaeota archaeon]|nr:hypothetical protein [Candidatus Aenigmarchaeota archaeon]
MVRVLVKASSIFIDNEQVIDQISEEADRNCVVYIHGAGKQFNEASEEEIRFENGSRVASQEQLEKFYHGPQQKIRDYLSSVFGNKVLIISPITEKDRTFENQNSDDIFKELYSLGFFEKGVVYAKKGHDKSNLKFTGVEIRYI